MNKLCVLLLVVVAVGLSTVAIVLIVQSGAEDEDAPQYDLPKQGDVGCAKSRDDRISDGGLVQIEDVPYHGSLHVDNEYACGVAILNNQYVLTAARCVYDIEAENVTIRTSSNQRETGGFVNQVKEIRIHPAYNSDTQLNDLAIIRLGDTLRFGTTAAPACLAEPSEQATDDANSASAFVAGYGKRNKDGPYTKKLRGAKVSIMLNSICNEAYKDKAQVVFTDSHTCAADKNKGSCAGDTGGGLFQSNALVAIVSPYGDRCGNPKFGGRYTNLAGYRQWLEEETAKKSWYEGQATPAPIAPGDALKRPYPISVPKPNPNPEPKPDTHRDSHPSPKPTPVPNPTTK